MSKILNNTQCPKCDKMFSTKSNLKAHFKNKTPCDQEKIKIKKEYICDRCLNSFSCNERLKYHKNKKVKCIKINSIVTITENNNINDKTIDANLYIEEIRKLNEQINTLTTQLQNNNIIPNINTGLIYLIQPEELFGTNRYKFGYSDQNNLKRVKSYGSNVKVYLTYSSDKAKKLESYILELLSEKHLKIKNEYFEIDDIDDVKNFILSSCINF